jgi:hypothetical protein
MMINEWWILKDFEDSARGLIWVIQEFAGEAEGSHESSADGISPISSECVSQVLLLEPASAVVSIYECVYK